MTIPVPLRPRERLADAGASSLKDSELVALLLGTGDTQRPAVRIAEELLGAFASAQDPSGLTGLLQAHPSELLRFRGVGPVKQSRLQAAQELSRRLSQRKTPPPARIASPDDAYRHLAPRLAHMEREHFATLNLNRKHAVLAFELVAIGSLEAVIVHPREVFRGAIRRGAAAVVLAHNHPSGDPTPSPEDIQLTRRLLQAGEIVGIEVLDHLVIGADAFVSLRETTPLWRQRTPG